MTRRSWRCIGRRHLPGIPWDEWARLLIESRRPGGDLALRRLICRRCSIELRMK